MTDDSCPPFILPDSVLKRRQGLLEGAMPKPLPRQWAEHLELLTADGKLTSVDDMLTLMRAELDRLQEQIDADEEPDRHSELVLAAPMAEMLDEKTDLEQRESRREVYFGLLLGYLYGRLTKPGKKSEAEASTALMKMRLDRERKSLGGKSGRTLSLEGFVDEWFEWVLSGSPGKKSEFDSDMAKRFNVSEKTIETERLKLQREYKSVEQNMSENP
ncbi:MAG: hypothetical protein U5L98_06660 [Halomonas sp.]|uniref:hypothetical protein n=1 Tax=Halomonas sp. TaxID=1486246 RepID=UPI002ACEFF61|nr:hypothetical protein [Halomonas sp.]MDZ7852324.1 hypothetical protein [Halomonas sp.]